MHGFICFGPGGKRVEVRADTSRDAQLKAAAELKIPASKAWKVSVHLAERNGVPVLQSTTQF